MSNLLQTITDRYRNGGFNAAELLAQDQEWVVCFSCRRRHPLRGNNADHDFSDFKLRHPVERGCVCVRMGPLQMERACRRAERRKKRSCEARNGFLDNASVLEAFGSVTAFDLTGVNSKASSATAGASTNYIDNHTNLYLEYLSDILLAAVNTAPASNQAFYVYGAGSFASSAIPTTGAASGNTFAASSTTGAALTFPNITTAYVQPPLVQTVPYIAQNVAIQTCPFGFAYAFSGWIPQYLWAGLVNFAGMTIATSGNVWNYVGVYSTVA